MLESAPLGGVGLGGALRGQISRSSANWDLRRPGATSVGDQDARGLRLHTTVVVAFDEVSQLKKPLHLVCLYAQAEQLMST